jgi:CRISPR type II-A-associated protein Csn2
MNILTLARYGIEPSITIPETHFFSLAVENKSFLLDVVSGLREQSVDGKEGSFTLLLDDRVVNFEKSVSAVFDFTDIDFNSKQITNLLAKKFMEFLGLDEQAEALTELETDIFNLVENFRLSSGVNVEYDTSLNGRNIAKACSLKIAENNRSLPERLCEYVNLLSDLKPLKLFVLVFAKQFLEKIDLKNLYSHCIDRGIRLLIIEGSDQSELLPNEKRLVIDKDLCIILQGYDEYENQVGY